MNLKNFLHKIRTIIEKNKASPAWLLISQLNPVIRGWVNYHRHVVAKKMFRYIDHQIWLKVWQWCVRRHLKAIATPYDPKWESYFERRQDYILENATWGKKRLLAIWRSQGSLCPICRQRITHETGWNVHHKVKKVMGAVKNYLTLSCYIQIAIDSYTVVKPALSKRGYKGLSGVPGNRYAPFLGEGSPAMNCPYPTITRNERKCSTTTYFCTSE